MFEKLPEVSAEPSGRDGLLCGFQPRVGPAATVDLAVPPNLRVWGLLGINVAILHHHSDNCTFL